MFSGEVLTLNEIDRYYKLWKNSLKCYRNEMLSENMDVPAQFIGCTKDELREEFNKLESEVEKCAVLNIITAVEAEFRIDFIIRVTKKYRCSISKKFRDVYRKKYKKKSFHEIPLKDVILKIWKEEFSQLKSVIDPYSEALNYRHWLCHGRWWEPKVHKRYDEKFDFDTVYIIAKNIYRNIPFGEKIR